MKQYPQALGGAPAGRHPSRTSKADRHFWFGILYAQVDSTDGARRALTRAVELDSAGTSKNTAIALRQLGFYDLLDKK